MTLKILSVNKKLRQIVSSELSWALGVNGCYQYCLVVYSRSQCQGWNDWKKQYLCFSSIECSITTIDNIFKEAEETLIQYNAKWICVLQSMVVKIYVDIKSLWKIYKMSLKIKCVKHLWLFILWFITRYFVKKHWIYYALLNQLCQGYLWIIVRNWTLTCPIQSK